MAGKRKGKVRESVILEKKVGWSLVMAGKMKRGKVRRGIVGKMREKC